MDININRDVSLTNQWCFIKNDNNYEVKQYGNNFYLYVFTQEYGLVEFAPRFDSFKEAKAYAIADAARNPWRE